MLQQYLPFTVLKQTIIPISTSFFHCCNSTYRLRYWNPRALAYATTFCSVATVLTVYGIETYCIKYVTRVINIVATVLTVYGIETCFHSWFVFHLISCNSTYRLRYWNTGYSSTTPPTNSKLQQYLPFTVLKHRWYSSTNPLMFQLQQYLPFTVLKLNCILILLRHIV